MLFGIARRCRRVLRRLWILPETRPILVGTTACLAINLAELLFALVNPCVMSSEIYSPACGDSMLVLQIIAAVKVALMLSLVNSILNPRLAVATSSQLGFKLPFQKLDRARVRGWAPASSKEVFQEAVRVIRDSQVQLILFLVLAIMAPTASFIAADLARAESPEYLAYMIRTCGSSDPGGWRPEWVAWRWTETVAITVATLSTYLGTLMLAIRVEMWSPAFMSAVKKMDVRWLNRSMCWSHWCQFFIGPPTVFVFAIGVKIKLLKATKTDMVVYVWASLWCLVMGLVLIAWTAGVDVILYRAIKQIRFCPVSKGSTMTSTRPSCWSMATGVAEENDDAGMPLKPQKPSKRIDLTRVSKGGAGFKQRQLQILICNVLLLLGTPFSSWWTVGALWFCKLASVSCVLLTTDVPFDMEELQDTEPGFGLLIDAEDLRAAILAHLSGTVYSGPLRKTRGSYYCMDDALTVSYRWQDSEVEVCPGLQLNMSRWQLSELEKGIARSSCIYVWIDRVALPQDESRLQKTLLSRMMAVYASSKRTLALRSLQLDGSRYHQRAWTLQELCNASEVDLVTQAVDEDAVERGLCAVAGDEDTVFPEAREWHQSRADACSPYWLSGLRSDDINVSLRRYTQISKQVFCRYTADKVRALYPLFFNSPCEDEAEMLALVIDVAYAASEASLAAAVAHHSEQAGTKSLMTRRDIDHSRSLPPEVHAVMPEEATVFVRMVRSKSSPGRLNDASVHDNGDVGTPVKVPSPGSPHLDDQLRPVEGNLSLLPEDDCAPTSGSTGFHRGAVSMPRLLYSQDYGNPVELPGCINTQW